MSPMIKIADLHSGYGDIVVLHGINIAVEKGKVTAILGSNGAGKTTLFQTISGLLPAFSGRIDMEGNPISTYPSHQRVESGIVLVPEGRMVFADMSVEENLRIGAFNTNARTDYPDTLKTVFELFPRLRERRKQAAGTLSGGEQQMMALGRGLMALPKVLLLDEPTLGLAPAIAKQIFQVIPNLVDLGLTVMIAEQDVHKTLKCADFGYVLENGKVAFAGTGGELLESPEISGAFLGH